MKRVRPVFPDDDAFQGRYRVVAELGAGGFGTVYEAVQRATGQHVAIKVLQLAGVWDDKAAEKRVLRLKREMQLCARLRHPNIVGLVDFGHSDDGSIYTVFELVPGKNLEEVIEEEGALEPAEARHLMLEVLDGLACAHAQGVIHRDLKPSNIMVTATGARRNALVLDFGIGVVADGPPGMNMARLTASNEVLGTIGYASPEQLNGRVSSPASDLYSWGLVFLECLTGIPVVQAASLMEALLKRAATAEVALPPALQGHALGGLLRAVLARRVEDRPAHAAEVMQRLEECSVADLRRPDLAQRLAGAPRPSEAWRLRAEPASETRPADSTPSQSRSSTAETLAASLPEPAPRPAEPGSDDVDHGTEPCEGERRQITAVCATLSVTAASDGSTDLEAADGLLHEGQEACARVAEGLHGHPVGSMGNQTIFWFGFPAASEDDARRAARAALDMIAEVERRPAGPGAAPMRLEIRVAVHTGIVLAQPAGAPQSPRLVASLGITSNIAAQLSTTAAPGEVVVSGATQQLLRQRFASSPLGTRSLGAPALGGLAAPIEVHRLERLRSPARAPLAERRDGELIGREHELELLLQRWREVGRGRGQAVLLIGEAGIGKSRLVRELGQRARSVPHRWIECRSAPEDQNNALRPVADMLERLIDLGDETAPAAKLDRLAAFLHGLGFALENSVPLFARLLGLPLGDGSGEEGSRKRPELSPHQFKEQLLHALVSLLFELAEREAVVLVAEDLHWTDATTLELCSMIVRELSPARILVLFSARPSFVPTWNVSDVLHMQLGRLEREQVRAMVTGLVGGEPLPFGVLDQIAERTDGIPLFVEELTRMMAESGMLAEPPGGARHDTVVEVPGTLRDLLTARLDRLGRAKGTAQIAAALGREFGFDVLAAVSPLGDERLVQEDVDALVAADLVHRKRRARGQSYAFKHALIRDTAYESMLKRARRKVHADIARALKERFADTPAARSDLLALHLAHGGQEAEASEYILRAADEALSRSANVEAMSYAQQAIDWLPAVAPGRERASLELHAHTVSLTAVTVLKGPGVPEVELHVGRAQALLEEVSDSPFLVPTLARIAFYYQAHGRFQEGAAVAERCLALAERTGDIAAQVAALTILTQGYYHQGELRAARAAAERALALYDPHRHAGYAITNHGIDFRATCQGLLGLLLWYQGYPDQALATAQRGVELTEELGHAMSTAISLLCLTAAQHYRRDLRGFDQALGQLQDIGKRHGIYAAALASMYSCCLNGDVEEPKKIIAAFRAHGQAAAMPYWACIVAEADAAAGRLDVALEDVAACIADAETTQQAHYLPEMLRLKGSWLVQRDAGAAAEAEGCFRRALALARAQGSRMFELRTLTSLLRWLGGTAEIRDELEALCRDIREGQSLPDLQEARAALAAPRG